MYTNAELQEILETLRSGAESEVVEFKEAKSTFSKNDIGEYFSALANEANLQNRPNAWLVFGIRNQDRAVVGSNAFADSDSLQRLKKEIADQVNNRITFKEIYAPIIEGKRVVMFEIPAAPRGMPLFWKGQYFGRDHESLVPLNIEELERIRGQARISRFEREIALDRSNYADLEKRLNLEAIFRALDIPRPDGKVAIVKRLVSERLLADNSTVENLAITNMGALLFAYDLHSFDQLRRKSVRVIVYEGKNKLRTIKEVNFAEGYAAHFAEMVRYINDQLPQYEEIGEALRTTERMYPPIAVRELFANMLIHQDYYQGGTNPMVEIYRDRVEFTNNGRPLIDTMRFLDEPPQSRNEDLASFMRRIGLCEERGSGIDKVVNEVENAHLPAPKFEGKTTHTIVTLYGYKPLRQFTQSERISACYLHACLRYIVHGEKLTNQSLRSRFLPDNVDSTTCWRIIKATLAEGLIKDFDPENTARKLAAYIPHWG
jgi:predicted HTH transcriptional regulator